MKNTVLGLIVTTSLVFSFFSSFAHAASLLNYTVGGKPFAVLISDSKISTAYGEYNLAKEELTLKDNQKKTYSIVSLDDVEQALNVSEGMMKTAAAALQFMPSAQVKAMGMDPNALTAAIDLMKAEQAKVNGYPCTRYVAIDKASNKQYKACIAPIKNLGLSVGELKLHATLMSRLKGLQQRFPMSFKKIEPLMQALNNAIIVSVQSKKKNENVELQSRAESAKTTLLTIPKDYKQKSLPSLDGMFGKFAATPQ